MNIFTAAQMREFDQQAIETYGIPSVVLMENAALRVVEFLEAKFSPLREKNVLILCGKGNNGGDGFAIARHLQPLCKQVQVLAEDTKKMSVDAKINALIWQKSGETLPYAAQSPIPFRPDYIVLDALLGTGFNGEIRGDWLERAFDILHRARQDGAQIVAIDIPSGLNADSGEAVPTCARADFTVSFHAPKRGFWVRDGLEKCGEIWIGGIGTTAQQCNATETGCHFFHHQAARKRMRPRPIDAHKGNAGRVMIIGGSRGMSGAIALASRASLQIGAGLCLACVPDAILEAFASSVLEATSLPMPCDESGHLLPQDVGVLREKWEQMQVVAIGPGISRAQNAQNLVRDVAQNCPVPLVIDADALHALPAIAVEISQRSAPTILTPHPGEMSALLGISTEAVQNDRFAAVTECAQKYGAFVVLKGAFSLIAAPDGAIWVNGSGNAGMATGGSGDVLTGTIAGLLAQVKSAQDATLLGVYLHGLAGDLAFETHGNGLIAGDIAAHLGRALRDLETSREERINGRLVRLC